MKIASLAGKRRAGRDAFGDVQDYSKPMAHTVEEDKIRDIPIQIIHLAAEATSNHNDGWTRQQARERLVGIRDYINRILR
jgi:hypothetical protein